MLHHDFSQQQLKKLLLFWTGTSTPPFEGALRSGNLQSYSVFTLSIYLGNNDLTIAKLNKKGGGSTALLPEAQTCDKHLYLPDYGSLVEVAFTQESII